MTDFNHRIAKNSPDPSSVYVVPGLNTLSVGFMLKPETLVANRVVPSVPVDIQSAKYATFPRGFFFRDEMQERADGAPSAGGGFEVDWSNSYNADVWAWHTDLGPQARANAKMVDLDQAATMLCSNKALLRREGMFFSKFFKSGVWTTQVHCVKSGSGGVDVTNLVWTDATAKPIAQLKAAMRSQQKLGGYKPNKATFSANAWDLFCEHPNVINRVNAGQTPGGPAEISTKMAAGWLGLEEVLVAEAVSTTSAENQTDALGFTAADGQVLLTYTPPTPGKLVPSAFYFFDWVADGLVGAYGNAMSRWFIQERKAMRYEIEMATDPKQVSADLGTFFYGVGDSAT